MASVPFAVQFSTVLSLTGGHFCLPRLLLLIIILGGVLEAISVHNVIKLAMQGENALKMGVPRFFHRKTSKIGSYWQKMQGAFCSYS